jgi:hypothetical protein
MTTDIRVGKVKDKSWNPFGIKAKFDGNDIVG